MKIVLDTKELKVKTLGKNRVKITVKLDDDEIVKFTVPAEYKGSDWILTDERVISPALIEPLTSQGFAYTIKDSDADVFARGQAVQAKERLILRNKDGKLSTGFDFETAKADVAEDHPEFSEKECEMWAGVSMEIQKYVNEGKIPFEQKLSPGEIIPMTQDLAKQPGVKKAVTEVICDKLDKASEELASLAEKAEAREEYLRNLNGNENVESEVSTDTSSHSNEEPVSSDTKGDKPYMSEEDKQKLSSFGGDSWLTTAGKVVGVVAGVGMLFLGGRFN